MQVWLVYFRNGGTTDHELEILTGIFDSETKAQTEYDFLFNLLDKLNDMPCGDWAEYLSSLGRIDLSDMALYYGINPFRAGVSIKGPVEVK